MSFKLFIYYTSLCAGWAAFVAWALAQLTGVLSGESTVFFKNVMVSAILGLLVAAAVGAIDALLHASGLQRLIRVGVCLAVGLFGGMLSGAVGGLFVLTLPFGSPAPTLRFIGWMLVGAAIGASIAIWDLIQASGGQQDMGSALRRLRNGASGGVLGGFLGGLLFDGLRYLTDSRLLPLEYSALAIGLVIVGLCIGLLIGLTQLVLMEAWVRVEAGFRPGREMMLAKEETTIGRAESCDLGLFGDPGVEKLHARIHLKNNRYLLEDNETPGGTYVNDQRVSTATLLKSGDLIRVGRNVLRFGARQKRK